MNTVPNADTGQRRPLGEEAIAAVERAAHEERGMAVERGALLRDLTATREHMIAEIEEVDRQLAWWQQRYPNEPAAVELGRAQERAAVQLAEAEARLASVGREQQAHEVAAAQLAEHAVALRAALDAARPDEPGPGRSPLDLPWVTSLLGKRVCVRWIGSEGYEDVGVLERMLRNEHGGAVVLLVVKQGESEVTIDPDAVAAIEEARTAPDGPGRARTAAGRIVAAKGTVDTDTAPVDVQPKGKGGA